MKKDSFLLIIVIIMAFISEILIMYSKPLAIPIKYELSFNNEDYRKFELNINKDRLYEYSEKININVGEYITAQMLLNKYSLNEENINNFPEQSIIKIRNYYLKKYPQIYKQMSSYYQGIIEDVNVFPVAESSFDYPFVTYVNSWSDERTYGGERHHEGTDICAIKNKDGIMPVISVCDGTVENIGWLELGGYRIGIVSENGIYYYYAHLDSYAQIKKGDKIKAGQLLGFMGSTGYSKVEGTKGKFCTHLHFGIYLKNEKNEDIAVNSFYILKNNTQIVKYNYSDNN